MRPSADDLQGITHGFRYVYACSTTGLSYCAPAYYADPFCDRGRDYLGPWLVNYEGDALRAPHTYKEALAKYGWGPKKYNSEIKTTSLCATSTVPIAT